jgi:hypothetical protein
MKRKTIRIGDVFEIALSDGRKAWGQYVFKDKKMGPLVQIFDLITEDEISLDQLRDAELLFPPVLTGLFAAIKVGFWNVIGHLSIERFVYPRFISTFYDDKTGKARIWYLWDGEKDTSIGRELSEEYKQLEFLCVWDPRDVVHRIETGENPYDDLIQTNRYTI